MDDVRATFLYAALEDTQGTIRSVDIRCGFLFVLLLSPMAIADKIVVWMIPGPHVWYVWLPIAAGLITWGASIGCLFAAVAAISNPADHVEGGGGGAFYSGDLFNLEPKHVFFDRGVKTRRTVDEEIKRLPSDETAIVEELTFERMKLAFIRDMKILRFNSGAFLAVVTGILALAAYGASLI